MLLCNYNQEVLQAEAEEMLASLPGMAATALLWFVKSKSNGDIDRHHLWRLPSWILSRVDDPTFDRWHAALMEWLRDL